ncbi:hypothetical protein PIB30_016480 [Stylosanthes scabra]|uniref:Uncharacterized protein n=1 Tax=Stylosanthes scabra TaxID=79078 RepID=A0ABU6Y5L8_9FABA|nr:hypothetical protein [Stylosanthes scabra]
MENELGRSLTQSKIVERTHTRKEDRSKLVDHHSQETNGITDLSLVSEEEVWPKTVGGCKRGRIYGVGQVSAYLTPPLTDGETADDISIASGPDLREEIIRLNRELTRQFELVAEESTKYAEL